VSKDIATGSAEPTPVTALLPAWQAESFIQETLDCLSAQTYGNFKVIVSVDLCDDGTAERCQAHAATDPRFVVVQQQHRLGYAGNCNALLDLADSPYALFAFHDDILAPAYIEKTAAALDANPNAVISFSDVHLTCTDGSEEHWEFSELEGETDPVRRGLTMLDENHQWWVPNRGLFRLPLVRQIGGVKRHGAGEYSCDWPWLFHMSLLGELVRVPEVLCYKHYQPGSLSRGLRASQDRLLEVYASCLRELWNSSLSTSQKLLIAHPLTNFLHQFRDALAPPP
jgi:glycosyltransferase involved in cell wall biosynthesis